MTRKKREKSHTGIYHVMLRGINRQNVFLDRQDMECMLRCLIDVQCEKDPNGKVISRQNCTYYAYCILHNHIHILIREGKLGISEIMKKVQDKYVAIYNRKYDRVGHLFQDRFASEPVQDIEYFNTLLRYIHRNPVKALEASTPEEYEFSSWREYLCVQKQVITGSDPLITQTPRYMLCDVMASIKRLGYNELVEWVNIANADDCCMDMDSFSQFLREEDAEKVILEISEVETIEYFKQLRPELQVEYIRRAMQNGVSIRQASRLSSLSYKALWNKLNPEEYQEQLRQQKDARRMKKMSNQRV